MKRPIHNRADPHPVNLTLGMESGSHGNAITTTILDAATVGSGGVWSISPSPLTTLSVTTGFEGGAWLRRVSVGGTIYTGSGGTRAAAYSHLTDNEVYTYTVTTNSQRVSVGFWHQTDLHTNDGSSRFFDLVVIAGGAVPNAAAVAQFADVSGTSDGVQSHGSSTVAGSTSGGVVLTSSGVKYWVTLLYDGVNGLARMRVYTASGERVGAESSCAIDTGIAVTRIVMGSNNHDANVAKTSLLDGVLVDWTNGTFPLGV